MVYSWRVDGMRILNEMQATRPEGLLDEGVASSSVGSVASAPCHKTNGVDVITIGLRIECVPVRHVVHYNAVTLLLP
jgi:hypothetical protein